MSKLEDRLNVIDSKFDQIGAKINKVFEILDFLVKRDPSSKVPVSIKQIVEGGAHPNS
jgi:hypothetical protein